MQDQDNSAAAPRIYYLHPTIGGGPDAWHEHVARAAAMGFTHLLLAWPFASSKDLFLTRDVATVAGQDARTVLGALAGSCRENGLAFWMDLAIVRAEEAGPLVASQRGCWVKPRMAGLDPRFIHRRTALEAAFDDEQARRHLIGFWQAQIAGWRQLGIGGLRCHDVAAIDLEIWRAILAPSKETQPSFKAFGWMPGVSRDRLIAAGSVFDFLPSGAGWWDGGRPSLVEDYNAVCAHAASIGYPQDPFTSRRLGDDGLNPVRSHSLTMSAAALMADGWLMPMGFEFAMEAPFADADAEDFSQASRGGVDLQAGILAANQAVPAPAEAGAGSMRALDLSGKTAVVARYQNNRPRHLVVLNRDAVNAVSVDLGRIAAGLGAIPANAQATLILPPAEGAVVTLMPSPAIVGETMPAPDDRPRLSADRIAIEAVEPVVDGGRFPVKGTVGDFVVVEADIFSDGHDVLAAELLWRAVDDERWSRAPMRFVVNDRWEGRFPLLRTGRHVFAIEAWWSEFGTYRRDLIKKRDAGLDIALEIAEGRLILESFARTASVDDRVVIEDHLARLSASQAESASVLTMDALRDAMERADPRAHATGSDIVYPVEADREGAAFASWYELFPRSITDDPARHGTFRDVIGRLPAIKAMGFDVLYFPPIHPIGKTNRKGRNNTLTPGADDPGSPYAIGSPDGGHDAIHPELGSREDFRALVAEAARHSLELALDFAIQCSPDHPWLTEHPDWFQWRPDGSMRYAENPPKKYQDIVNVDFYASDAIPGLWVALRDVVQSWVDEGVRLFRVDNPHTKPFPFWEWLIADIRSRDPGVLFLAEAFTRPKVMYRLGKVGFSQSYTYFTWRNTKAELTEYLTQLNEQPARDIFRPHFFVNTPDINPVFLQRSGRPGFLIRAALAATLSGLWGVYSGFELCEAAGLPGKEEYLDSEKYEIRPRDWQAPGNIIAEITRLNLIRRSHKALQSHLGVSFYNASNDNILYFGKRVAGSAEIILVAVNLDPFAAQIAQIEVPLWEFGLADDASIAVEDLMAGHRFDWRGKTQTIELDPQDIPFRIWRIAAPESTAL